MVVILTPIVLRVVGIPGSNLLPIMVRDFIDRLHLGDQFRSLGRSWLSHFEETQKCSAVTSSTNFHPLADLIFYGITGNYCAIRFSHAVFCLKQPAESQNGPKKMGEDTSLGNIFLPESKTM